MLRYDGPFITFLMKLGDMIILHVLWLLCSLPVITAGPALAAAHYAALRIVRDEGGSVCSMFFKAFRINFFQALPLGVISILAGAVIGTDLYLLSGPVQPKGAAGLFMLALTVFLSILYGILMLWLWPVLVTFENTWMGTIKSAYMMAASNWGATSAMILQDLVLGIAAVFSIAFLPQAAIIFRIFGCPLFFVVNAFHIRRAFDRIRENSSKEDEDE